MSRITSAFLNKSGRAALMPFLNAGDPTADIAEKLFVAALDEGADIVEIGTPYSDPLADGPVVQASALRSLRAGFQLPRVFELTAKLRQQTEKALVLFTYVNPLLQYTPQRFFDEAARAGADGVIVPDLPFEESEPVRSAADAAGVALIPLIAPTSGAARIAQICQNARGFVYCVSSLGVTGERVRMSERVHDLVAEVRRHTDLPIAVGFGVSTPEQADAISRYADGVIVGSAFVRRVEQCLPSEGDPAGVTDDLVQAVRNFTQTLKQALQG